MNPEPEHLAATVAATIIYGAIYVLESGLEALSAEGLADSEGAWTISAGITNLQNAAKEQGLDRFDPRFKGDTFKL